ncbi:hypothetical protein ABLE94_00870 [Gordonia sp. VNK1]|jgi:hypothetical protein|uniref:hypothetical protein n=1 Tax=Gordonia oleivorans TaxID=3156618 RepID=UPI0032B52F38
MPVDRLRAWVDSDVADVVEQCLSVDPADADISEPDIDSVTVEAADADLAEQALPVGSDDPDEYRDRRG